MHMRGHMRGHTRGHMCAYLMRLRACRVETMSSVLIADISESCLIEIAPGLGLGLESG